MTEGFEKGDKTFHIIDERNRSEHLRRLQEAGIEVTGAEGRGPGRGPGLGERSFAPRLVRPARHARLGGRSVKQDQASGVPVHPLGRQRGLGTGRGARHRGPWWNTVLG
ncbi:MAG: hypothetical protein ACREV3_05395 [Gammaproteobacteria bacterium]